MIIFVLMFHFSKGANQFIIITAEDLLKRGNVIEDYYVHSVLMMVCQVSF